MTDTRRTWAEVDLDCIRRNYKALTKRLSESCKVMAVVKADAYGHGDGYISRALQKAGAHWFAVSDFKEALSLRAQGITRPILILGYTPVECVSRLAELSISQAVYSMEYAQALSVAATAQAVQVDCHIKLDTGMTRIGFYAHRGMEAAAADEAAAACALPGLACTGIFTHFCCADELNADSDSYTAMQFASFQETIRLLEERGIRFSLRHCCNSAASLRFPQMHLDMVRFGVVLYGLTPSPECSPLVTDLSPAMRLYSTVTLVKSVEAGVPVSYGRTYTTTEENRVIASMAVGYADGYRRNFTNKGRVIVNGQYAKVVGRVCMDQTMIDVTGIPDVRLGDRVILAGEENGCSVTLDDFAALNGTINYEETCLIGRRVPRIYIENGREIASVDYILQALEK